jgi:predicted nucleic acid-binding protein
MVWGRTPVRKTRKPSLREKNRADAGGIISDVREFVNVMPLSEEHCIEAAGIDTKIRKEGAARFSLVDGIVLASARSIGQTLLVKDGDFLMAKDAIVMG